MERTWWVGERVDRLCTERHPGAWHNGRSPRHVDASHDFFIIYSLFSPNEQRAGGGGGRRCQTFEHRPPPYNSLLSVDCAWFLSQRYHTFIAKTNLRCEKKPSTTMILVYVQKMYKTCTEHVQYI